MPTPPHLGCQAISCKNLRFPTHGTKIPPGIPILPRAATTQLHTRRLHAMSGLPESLILAASLQVLVSLAAVAAFALVGIPLIGHYAGLAGIVKFWLMPWLGYHFWMSTFTVVHHTAPHIPFKPAKEWNAAKAQLSGTVHCDYPRLYAFLLTAAEHACYFWDPLLCL